MLQEKVKSPRQQLIGQLESLLKQLDNIGDKKSELKSVIIEFGVLSRNLKIANNFSGLNSYDLEITDDLVISLKANIRAAIGVVNGSSLQSPRQSINISNFQKQNQSVEINIMEVLRKSLTGEQFDDIKNMIERNENKKTISDKLKEFGSDVLAGVLSSLISTYLNGGY